MIGTNKVILIGNMTADPELKKGQRDDSDMTRFGIAINRPKRRGDDREPEPTFIDCIVWGKQAPNIADWGRKGRLVYVEGSLDVRKFEDREGNRRIIYRVKADIVNFLDPRQESRERREDRREPSRASDFDDLPF